MADYGKVNPRIRDLSRLLAFMESHGGPDVALALGSEPFRVLSLRSGRALALPLA